MELSIVVIWIQTYLVILLLEILHKGLIRDKNYSYNFVKLTL